MFSKGVPSSVAERTMIRLRGLHLASRNLFRNAPKARRSPFRPKTTIPDSVPLTLEIYQSPISKVVNWGLLGAGVCSIAYFANNMWEMSEALEETNHNNPLQSEKSEASPLNMGDTHELIEEVEDR